MKYGTNYASLRIPFGIPLKMIQFRFGEYETDDPEEIEILTNHPDTYPIGGEADDNGAGNGNAGPEQVRKNSDPGKRVGRGRSGQ